jgi:hypothetical protein
VYEKIEMKKYEWDGNGKWEALRTEVSGRQRKMSVSLNEYIMH